ncbi:hypothetical protein DH2020_005754 [Rehmannia glutinosa]|uniref:Uncharacterized protein n=1 Tax=Rehmannia glutinosa TaxID=99300 RepID=A0ABR0XGW0_REHGL
MKGRWSEIFPAAEKPAEPAHPLSTHNFFKWADVVKPDEFIDVPYCGGCMAGVCRVRKEKSGPNAGRVLFMCRVKEVVTLGKIPGGARVNGLSKSSTGEGSCGYRVWHDELQTSAIGRADESITSSQSPTVNNDYTRPANTYLVKENGKSNGRADNESPVINTSEHLHCPGVTSRKMDQCLGGTSKKIQQLKCQENQRSESSRRAHRISDERITSFQSPTVNRDFSEPANTDLVEENNQRKEQPDNESPVIDTSQHLRMEQLKCQENQPIESLRRPHKRSRYGDFKAPSSLISSVSLTVGPTMNSVSTEHCWMVAAIRQNLSTQLQGWWGRLAFHPMPCLTTHASKPLTFYISSPLNSTFVVQDNILVNSRDSATLTTSLLGVESYRKPLYNPGHVAELSGTKTFRAALDVSSCSDPFTETSIQNAMSKSISNAFSLAAEHLQNDFLALLEKTDVKDHETMSRAAEATFAALDRLLFDNQDFKTRAEEYIHCATSLAEIERSMPGNESYQKLVDRCSSERTRLDEINSVHAKAVDSMTNNKKRLKVLQEEISSTMDWLFQIEAELSCCEVEMRNMENELDQISKNKGVLEEKYLTAANELEKLKTLCEQKEANAMLLRLRLRGRENCFEDKFTPSNLLVYVPYYLDVFFTVSYLSE